MHISASMRMSTWNAFKHNMRFSIVVLCVLCVLCVVDSFSAIVSSCQHRSLLMSVQHAGENRPRNHGSGGGSTSSPCNCGKHIYIYIYIYIYDVIAVSMYIISDSLSYADGRDMTAVVYMYVRATVCMYSMCHGNKANIQRYTST
jgi:hypothetical protein